MRNRTSDLKTLHSNALPLSYKDSMGSKVITKFTHDTHPVYCEDQQYPFEEKTSEVTQKQFSLFGLL